jgi:hypothetical protein
MLVYELINVYHLQMKVYKLVVVRNFNQVGGKVTIA